MGGGPSARVLKSKQDEVMSLWWQWQQWHNLGHPAQVGGPQ